MRILACLSFMIISITGFVIGLILNDHLLMTLSWVSSVGFFIFTILDALGIIDPDF